MLAALPAARDFVTDAFAHCKFIGYAGDAAPLFEAAGLGNLIDDGFVDLGRHLRRRLHRPLRRAAVLATPGQHRRAGGTAKASAGRG